MEQLNKTNEDEITLYDLWKVIIKRKKMIIGLFLIFVIPVAIVSFYAPKIYKGEAVLMVLPAVNMTAKEVTDFFGKIDDGTETKILPKTHDLISDIKLKPSRESTNKIEVIVESKDTNAIQPALSEVIDYINTIDLVKSNVKEQQEKLLKQSTELSSVIAESSALLNTYVHLLKSGKFTPVGFNPLDLNRKIYDMKLEKLQMEQSLQRLKGGVEIARQLYVSNHSVKPAKKKNVMIAGMSGLFLGIVLAFFMEYVERIKKMKQVID
jgi:uncharacterized protein involved in exopolysaccharide biosynthesis